MAEDDAVRELIAGLTSCRQLAEKLQYTFLSDLIAAALLEAGMQSIGGNEALANPETRLEKLIELKFKTAFGQLGNNIIAMGPRGKPKAN